MRFLLFYFSFQTAINPLKLPKTSSIWRTRRHQTVSSIILRETAHAYSERGLHENPFIPNAEGVHTSLSLYSLLQNVCLFVTKDKKNCFSMWGIVVMASTLTCRVPVCRWIRWMEETAQRHLAELSPDLSRPLTGLVLPNLCSSACDITVNEMKKKVNKTDEKCALQHTATNRMHACLFTSASSSFSSWIFMFVFPCLLCCLGLASVSAPAHSTEGTGDRPGTENHNSPPADNTRRQRSKVANGWKQVSALQRKKQYTNPQTTHNSWLAWHDSDFLNLIKTRRRCNKSRYIAVSWEMGRQWLVIQN